MCRLFNPTRKASHATACPKGFAGKAMYAACTAYGTENFIICACISSSMEHEKVRIIGMATTMVKGQDRLLVTFDSCNGLKGVKVESNADGSITIRT